MQKEIMVQVKEPFAGEFRKGYPLVAKEAVADQELLKTEGQVMKLTDVHGRFIAKAYYGEQNKGLGWVLTRNEEEIIDQAFFERKLATSFERRADFFEDTETTAFRVFHGEGDGIGGLTIDYYDGFYLMSWYSAGIYAFKKMIVAALKNTAEFKGVYEKKRFDTKGQYMEDDDFVTGERGEFPIIVKENSMNFAVYLNDGAMTGIFLDQREVRRQIRDHYAYEKTVLNTFSYTGAFSVAAALGGAMKTTSVDLAKRSSAKTIEQFSVNALDYESQEIRVMDVFNYFDYAKKNELKFDMVVLDPPSFARSKKFTFSAAKDYTKLMKDAIAITSNKGMIVASTNNGSFGMKKFKEMIDKAFQEQGKRYTIVEEYRLPRDFHINRMFKEGDYLKVLFIRLK